MGQAQFGRAGSPSVLFQSCLAGLSCVPDIESLASPRITSETVVLSGVGTRAQKARRFRGAGWEERRVRSEKTKRLRI